MAAVLAKIAVAVAPDKRVQMGILAAIVGVIAFVFLIFGTFFSIMNTGTKNNQDKEASSFT